MIGRGTRVTWIAVVVASVALFGTTAGAEDDALGDLLSAFYERYDFPGATAAIALPDGEIVTAATGLADVEADRPMSPDTPMLAASIGKSFVAATVLSLESDGLLSREDLVSDHLGGVDWFARLPNHATMTVGDLLRHGAGLPDHVHLKSFQIEMAGRMGTWSAAFTPEEAIAFVLDADPLFDAGAAWAYTDTGYLLLGLVIEAASGRSYHDLVAKRFLRPLSLANTRPSDTRTLPGLAAGYVAEDNPFGLPPRTNGLGRHIAVESGDGMDGRRAGLDLPRPGRVGSCAVHCAGDGGPLSRPPA